MQRNILVVEDDDDVRESLEALLERRGLQVVTAADGREALEAMMRDGPPALVILDLMMPTMNGWALRAHMLADPALARVPVVVVSGIVDAEQHGRALQAAAILPKPFALDALYAAVDALA